MTKTQIVRLLAGASLLACAAPAFAQDASDSGTFADDGDIVVTATRRRRTLAGRADCRLGADR